MLYNSEIVFTDIRSSSVVMIVFVVSVVIVMMGGGTTVGIMLCDWNYIAISPSI